MKINYLVKGKGGSEQVERMNMYISIDALIKNANLNKQNIGELLQR